MDVNTGRSILDNLQGVARFSEGHFKTLSVRGADRRVHQCGLDVACVSNTAFGPTCQQSNNVPLYPLA